MRRRRRPTRTWTVPVLLLADATVFVMYVLSGSGQVLAAGLVGLAALVLATVLDHVGRPSGRRRRT